MLYAVHYNLFDGFESNRLLSCKRIISFNLPAVHVEMPRLSGRLDPRGGLVEEEVHGPGPREERGERVDRWLPRNALPVPV